MEKRRTLNNHLPGEVIEEILYNLPVKSLLRFKCVSKSWRSLISSKRFVKEHLRKSSTDIDSAHRKLMLSFCQSPNSDGLTSLFRNPKSLRSCYLRSLFDSSVIKTLKKSPPKGSFRYIIRILGSCNGLILITINQRNLFLWNPCTRKIKNIGLASSSQESRFIYGLGYDEYTDDYKVVSITRSCHHNPCNTNIYSSKEDSWKKIEDFDKGFPIDDSGKLVNGRLHWLAAKGDGENHRFWPMLKNLGGYLTLISRSSGTLEDIDVWVMIKYGERQSWTKIWTCSEYDDLMKHIDDGSMFNCLKMNGYIAVDFGLDFIVYKRKGELRKSRVDMIDATIESNFYVESLVSPFRDEEVRVW